MLDKHEQFARDAAAAGRAGDLLPGAVLRPVLRHHRRTRSTTATPSRPTARSCSGSRRSPKELGIVMVLPIYEEEQTGVYYNTAVRRRRRRHDPRQVPQAPHPAPRQVLGEVLLPPGQPRLPGVRHRRRQDRRLHLLRPALPRGLARARPERRADRLQPERHQARPVEPAVGDRAAGAPPSPTATSSLRPTGSGREDNEYGDLAVDFYGTSQFVDPRGNFVGERGSGEHEEVADPRPRPGHGARRCATTGSSTATAGPDSYTPIAEAVSRRREGAYHDHHLITGGTVVSATGRAAADVLIDGETIVAVLAPGLGAARHRPRGIRRHRHRRDRQVRDPRRHRRAHPHGAAVRRHRRVDTFETGTRAAAWGGTTSIIDFAVQRYGERVAGRPRRLAREGRGQLRDRLRLPPDHRRRRRRLARGDGRR